jgi:hypothetical protein
MPDAPLTLEAEAQQVLDELLKKFPHRRYLNADVAASIKSFAPACDLTIRVIIPHESTV